ncbi:hypothetical protein BBW65_00595 [Helicobacter enhydrae]|uniref:Uncharacterized protein n=1 Tax=Helicobacter enhydrae TaxID=222136 RepID=A0A1B1U3Y5_9HELI|nr:hypothetical protein BBW65_00595 [Helicobacter enhydrae]
MCFCKSNSKRKNPRDSRIAKKRNLPKPTSKQKFKSTFNHPKTRFKNKLTLFSKTNKRKKRERGMGNKRWEQARASTHSFCYKTPF